ncbi:ribosome biogenesis GTPase YqeH [Ectobacillus polymachus]|uniref:ribosome biogenesis GTPase YqeH n=1 Tax=Ectobacillus polymachus TaxID=1508806 RepID=UPI003A870C32
MEEVLKCVGCGAVIQTEHPKEIGYAPPSSLEKDHVVCMRCFRLKHYNEIQDVSLTDDDFLRILNGIGQSDALVIKLVDIFDFNGSWLPGLHRFVGQNPVLLVGNKVDLLPKAVKPQKLIHWMKYSAKQLGLKPLDVFVISAHTGNGVAELAGAIETYRQGRDVYVVGCTNVGKSTFINRIIKDFGNVNENVITTSHFPGTTLDIIDIPLDHTTSLYDTPGIINHHQMAHYVNKKSLKTITPSKEVKAMVFQLNEQQTLFFGGMARFDYVSGGRRSFVCYVSNAVHIHRTKLEKADEVYAKHLGELLSPPFPEEVETFPELVRHEFVIHEPKMDVVISGLGWITINEPGAKIAIHVPKGVSASIRKSLI